MSGDAGARAQPGAASAPGPSAAFGLPAGLGVAAALAGGWQAGALGPLAWLAALGWLAALALGAVPPGLVRLRGRRELFLLLPGVVMAVRGVLDSGAWYRGVGAAGQLPAETVAMVWYLGLSALLLAASDAGSRDAKLLVAGAGVLAVAGRSTAGLGYSAACLVFGVAGSLWVLARWRRTLSVAERGPGGTSTAAGASPTVGDDQPVEHGFPWPTSAEASHMALALAFGCGMAWFLPRLEQFLVERYIGSTQGRSGFGAVTDLNSIGPGLLSDAVMLEIESSRQPGYLRGSVYDRYRGGRWIGTHRTEATTGAYAPGVAGAGAAGGGALHAEPRWQGSVWCPATGPGPLLSPPGTIWVDAEGAPVTWDPYGVARARAVDHWRFEAVPPRSAPFARPTTADLEVPAGFDVALAGLAAAAGAATTAPTSLISLTSPASPTSPTSPTTTATAASPTDPAALAGRVVAWVEGSATYALTREAPPRDQDPLLDFLLRNRRGHCELFASAAVVLLRMNSVPARYVTGYCTGERNPLTGTWLARESHGHAWVEAWLPGQGWTTLDPTPAGERGAGTSDAGRWIGYLTDWFAAGVGKLVRALDPRPGLARLVAALDRATAFTGRSVAELLALSLTLLLAAVALAYGGRWLARWLRRRRAEERAERDVPASVARARALLGRAERALGPLGLARRPAETVREFAARSRAMLAPEGAAALGRVVEVFCACRYGDLTLGDELASLVDADLLVVTRAAGGGGGPHDPGVR